MASEFDVLQLQSLGARLAQTEGLKPQAGYPKARAVGDGKVDAATVRALGQLPLVIRNGGNPAAAARVVDAIRQEVNLYAVTVPGSRTLDEWLREQPSELAAGKALLNLAATKTFVARPYMAVRREIDGWRSLEGREVKKFEADRWASDTLVRDITQRGQLFYDGREGDHDADNVQDRYEALISSVKEWNGADVHSERPIELCSCHAPRPADSPSVESSS